MAFGPYENTRVIFDINSFAAFFLITFLITIAVYGWYQFFNKRSIITIGYQGIIYNKKLIKWQDIKSYKTINYTSDIIDTLHLVLNADKEYTISLLGFNTDKQHIRTCIESFANISLIDEGHFDKN